MDTRLSSGYSTQSNRVPNLKQNMKGETKMDTGSGYGWLDKLPGIIRDALQVAIEKHGADEDEDGDGKTPSFCSNIDWDEANGMTIEAKARDGFFQLLVVPMLADGEGVGLDDPLLSLTIKPYGWWIKKLEESPKEHAKGKAR